MVYLHRLCFLVGSDHKSKDMKIGPCYIFHKINHKAYIVNLPLDLHISKTFDVVDLFEYHPPEDHPVIIEYSGSSSFLVEENDVKEWF